MDSISIETLWQHNSTGRDTSLVAFLVAIPNTKEGAISTRPGHFGSETEGIQSIMVGEAMVTRNDMAVWWGQWGGRVQLVHILANQEAKQSY